MTQLEALTKVKSALEIIDEHMDRLRNCSDRFFRDVFTAEMAGLKASGVMDALNEAVIAAQRKPAKRATKTERSDTNAEN